MAEFELAKLLARLEESQRASPSAIAAHQINCLAELLKFAAQHSPYYQHRLGDPDTIAWKSLPEVLAHLPLLTRQELQKQQEEINCRAVPGEHGAWAEAKSSGSTGRMVTVRRTWACMQYWLALTMREHLWHRRDFSKTLAIIRPLIAENDPERRGVMMSDWGPPASLLYKTGLSCGLNIMTDVAQQAAWLERCNPHYLLTFPNNLEALLRIFESKAVRPHNLCQVRTIGETLPESVRQHCHAVLGVDIIDTYSSQELGVIAAQCPDSGLYHVMEENLVVEVLDDMGNRCGPGEIGRLVVTDLHNFATPLIRYDTGDYAEVGPVCSCGRGLATFARIVGRSRNMVMLPDGRRFWPLVGAYSFRDVAPVSQYQLLQHGLMDVEVRLVVEVALTSGQEQALADIIQRSLGYPFPLRFGYFEHELPRHSNGKFEEFICLIAS